MIELFGKKYITEKEASKRYGYSCGWFQRQRWKKCEPNYVQLKGVGKIFYPLDETDKWFKDNLI